MRRPRFWPIPSLLVALLLAAGAAELLAYTVYLKDGSRINAKEKYRIEGDRAIITLLNGTESFLPASEIDVARTAKANETNYGTAMVFEGGEVKPMVVAPKKDEQPSLSQYIAKRGDVKPRIASPAPARRAPAERARVADSPRGAFADREAAEQIQSFFLGQGVDEVQVLAGSAPARPLVEIRADSEASVFRGLEVAANALIAASERFPQQVAGFDLVMTTSDRELAGQFLLTPELAEGLVRDEIAVSDFFVNYVRF